MLHPTTFEEFTALGSAYVITGAGGQLASWTTGYAELMEDAMIFKAPTELKWATWTGAEFNQAFGLSNTIAQYSDELVFLAFALDEKTMDLGRLAMFKIRREDRWLDDIIANNKRLVREQS